MTDVRSQRLAFVTINTDGGQAVAFVVPTDHVILLKSMYVYSTAAATSTVDVYAATPADPLLLLGRYSLTGPQTGVWEGWIALNPGDYILMSATLAPTYAWLSGAVLAGPPPFPELPREIPAPLPAPGARR